MLKKIEALRKKPKHIRNRYAFWTAALVTLVIVAVWGTTLPSRIQNTTDSDALSDDFSEFGEVVNQFSSNISDTLSGVRTQAELYQAQQEEAAGTTTSETDFSALLESLSSPSKQQKTVLIGTTTASDTPKNP